jgi:tRNA(Ile)-lysidine synthase
MDASNQENTFFRNRLRNELIPFLETYNPNIKQGLLRSNLALKDDHDWLQQELDLAWKSLCPEFTEQAVWFDQDKFLAFPTGAQRNLLRKMIALIIPHTRDISFRTVQTGLLFIQQPSQSQQVTLEQGMVLRKVEKKIILSNNPAFTLISQEGVLQVFSHAVVVPVPGEVQLKNGKRIFAELLSISEARNHPDWNNPQHAFLDRDKIADSLLMRPAKVGERFCPLGMDGRSIKLSDFWTNTKLPRELRKHWPVLSQKDEIVWLPGFRIAHAFRISAVTTEIVHLWVA